MSKVSIQLGQTCLAILICLSFSSCNKSEEFYQKDNLSNPASEGPSEGDGGLPGDGGSSDDGGSAGGGSSGGGSAGGVDVTENFQQNASLNKLDIVWVIDNSGSMADEQQHLGKNFDAFINDFISKSADFKMGITTTDTSSSDKCGKMVLGSNTKLTSAKAAQSKNQFLSDFNSLVQVGTTGSGYEKGLEASKCFIEKHAATFLRPEAYLAVVILSDEEDQSSGEVSSYVDSLRALKSNAGLVKVYSIVDVNKANSGSGVKPGGDRYIAASSATAGVSSDIRVDFAQALSDMGDSLINLLDSFALAANPLPGTLKVYVNDQLVTYYSYDQASSSIKFDPNSLPQVGANIRVTYKK